MPRAFGGKLSDPPSTLGRMPDFRPFAQLTAPKVDLHRAMMGKLVPAERWFVVHLCPEDVHEELDADLTTVSDALVRLKHGAVSGPCCAPLVGTSGQPARP